MILSYLIAAAGVLRLNSVLKLLPGGTARDVLPPARNVRLSVRARLKRVVSDLR